MENLIFKETDFWNLQERLFDYLPTKVNVNICGIEKTKKEEIIKIVDELQKEEEESAIGRNLFARMEEKFPLLFCCAVDMKEDDILCKVARKTIDGNTNAIIFTDKKDFLHERMIYTLCGVYWYLTNEDTKREEVFTLKKEDLQKDFAKEAYFFASEYLLRDKNLTKEIDQWYKNEKPAKDLFMIKDIKDIEGKLEKMLYYLIDKYEIPGQLVFYRLCEKMS